MRLPLVTALLLSVTALIYAPTLGYGLVYEDDRDPAALLEHSTLVTQITTTPMRSLTALSHAATRAVFGIQPWAFHLGSLMVHLVNVGLCLALAWLLLPPWAAIAAAGVFAWHPLQVEAVVYVSSRSELLAGTGVLLALLATSLGSLPGAVVGLVFAALAKETALVAWGLVPLWAVWTRAPFPVRRYLYLSAPVALGAAVWLWQAQRLTVTLNAELAGTQMVAVLRLLALVFWPWGFTVDHDWQALQWLWMAALVVGVCLTAWALTEGWQTRSRWALAWVFTLVALSPRFVVPLYEGLHEHHYLTPMIAWSLACGAWLMPRKGVHHD